MSSFPPSSPSSSSSSSSLSSSSSSESDSDNDEGDYNQEGQGVNAPPLTVKAAKDRYRKMKVHLHDSIRSNEMLKEELKRYQRLLLRINQDKYFLFERLLSHEKPPPKKSSKNASAQQSTSSSTLPTTGEVKVPKKRGPKPKKRPADEVVPSMEDSLSLPPPASLIRTAPAGQSLLKLKLSTTATGSGSSPPGSKKTDKSGLVFRTPSGSRKGQKRKVDFSEDSSSNDADHLFREAASKTTEQVPDQLFDDGHLVGH